MSQGKYSPVLVVKPRNFNCYGKVPAPWSLELEKAGVVYDEKTMFADFDDEGYDSYGYSSFDSGGNFVGFGQGVDRQGYTELDYLRMSPEEFHDCY
jgi:hypothetical protein